MAEKKTGKIICTALVKVEDMISSCSKTVKHIHPTTKCSVDTGYEAIAKLHSNVEILKERSKKNPLTVQDIEKKQSNLV